MKNLLVVGLMEPSMEGAVLSPTFSCLLAKVNAWEFNVVIALSSVADPVQGSGSGSRCLFNPGIRDLGWVKNQDPGLG